MDNHYLMAVHFQGWQEWKIDVFKAIETAVSNGKVGGGVWGFNDRRKIGNLGRIVNNQLID